AGRTQEAAHDVGVQWGVGACTLVVVVVVMRAPRRIAVAHRTFDGFAVGRQRLAIRHDAAPRATRATTVRSGRATSGTATRANPIPIPARAGGTQPGPILHAGREPVTWPIGRAPQRANAT